MNTPSASSEETPQPQEIERKFLITEPPEGTFDSYKIDQGYLQINEDGSEVRIRRKLKSDGTEQYIRTEKSGGDKTRTEIETEISKEEFEAQWQKTEGLRVEKRRFAIPLGDVLIEMDVYEGSLEGLLVAEVEFPSEEASNIFVVPAWFGQEVTTDKAYKNKNLAKKGLPLPDIHQEYGFAARISGILTGQH